ncbi:hypothetical protein [Bacteroides neonati]|uniref:hypothetical protein n=1 Tax=Bacteroides neonati TaxID=1347393 RepID=UPI0004AD809B|nr:hypothetical protein [Bacteroides neonati]
MATDKEDVIIFMIEELTKLVKQSSKFPQVDLSKVETLTVMMQSSIDQTADNTTKLKEVIEEARKPVVRERRITIDIVSKEAVFIFIGMLIIIAGLSAWLYLATRPNYDRIDNDLKYRYIKMKGEATPQRISELENLFEINRDNTKIRQMSKDVEEYERAVKEKATIDEQTRLRQQEAEKLNHKANSIKSK